MVLLFLFFSPWLIEVWVFFLVGSCLEESATGWSSSNPQSSYNVQMQVMCYRGSETCDSYPMEENLHMAHLPWMFLEATFHFFINGKLTIFVRREGIYGILVFTLWFGPYYGNAIGVSLRISLMIQRTFGFLSSESWGVSKILFQLQISLPFVNNVFHSLS